MRRSTRCMVLGIPLLTLTGLAPRGTLAAPLHIGASVYPAHTRITVLAPLSNTQMDCAWGFTCRQGVVISTAPLFHFNTQDALHRVSGWAQLGQARVGKAELLFAVYASRYADGDWEGLPWNIQAFSDFRTANMAYGYVDPAWTPRLAPSGVAGNSGVQIARGPDGDVLAMVCWAGSIEVEGVAIYPHHSPADARLARRDLTAQIRTAVREMLPGQAS